jgi:hypothetical protein
MERDAEAPPPAVQRGSLKEDYATEAATVLGSLHLLCGLITLTASIECMNNAAHYAMDYEPMEPLFNIYQMVGIWCSILFIISGGLAIGGARSGNRCLVVATLVMAVISAVSAGILLIIFSPLLFLFFSDTGLIAMNFLGIVTFLAMLGMGITTAALTCRALCCPRAATGALHYTPAAMEGDTEAPPPAALRSLKEDYATKAATVLGSLHLLCGLITLAASIIGNIYGNWWNSKTGGAFSWEQDINSKMLGIWCSVFFFISGGLAIGGARSGNRFLMVATLVMAVISAVSAFILFYWKCSEWPPYHEPGISMFALILTGPVMLVVGIITAALTCRPLCWCPQRQRVPAAAAVAKSPCSTAAPQIMP